MVDQLTFEGPQKKSLGKNPRSNMRVCVNTTFFPKNKRQKVVNLKEEKRNETLN